MPSKARVMFIAWLGLNVLLKAWLLSLKIHWFLGKNNVYEFKNPIAACLS
jgi:hypothetical protein